MLVRCDHAGIFIWGLTYRLGGVHRTLIELKMANLLANPVDALNNIGYRHNYGAGVHENLLTLAETPLSRSLKKCPTPRAMVFHHSYVENAVLPCGEDDTDLMSRCRYFPATLLKHLQLDHVPYFGSFASGCCGFPSMLLSAIGLIEGLSNTNDPVICLTADIRPQRSNFDALREKILTSDCSSAFIVGRETRGYQLLGINYYSTARSIVPLVEVVKRTVLMIRNLAQDLSLQLDKANSLIHYPNIFPEAWTMVTHYLGLDANNHVLDELPDRAHCLSSDSVITLSKLHNSERGRLHVIVNFGSGLHLGVCILKEIADSAPTA